MGGGGRKRAKSPFQPGLLLRLFLEPKSLTREKTFNLFLSQLVLPLLGLLTHLQALDFSRSRACLFCRISELAIAAAMATTPTTTTSFAAPLRLRRLLPRLRGSPARSRTLAACVSPAGARPGCSALRRQPRRGLSMPSELLRRWSGSRAGCWLPGSSRRHSPGPGSQRDGQAEAELRDCVRSALRPEDTVQVRAARAGVSRHPPPRATRRGPGGEAGGGRRERGWERGGERGRREGGGGGRARALALAPPSRRLVPATSWPDPREELACASFPTGLKQVTARHLRGGGGSGRGTVSAEEFRRRGPLRKSAPASAGAPPTGAPPSLPPRLRPPSLPRCSSRACPTRGAPDARANTCRGQGRAPPPHPSPRLFPKGAPGGRRHGGGPGGLGSGAGDRG